MQPNKMAKVCKGKAVLVSVFVERPRKRRISSSSSSSSSSNIRHLHHHSVHHNIKQEVKVLDKLGDSGRKGYSRRAELLLHSQRLRQSARSAQSTPFVPLPISSNHQPTTNTVAAPRKPRSYVRRTPTCLGNIKIWNPNFWGCLTISSPQAKQSKKKKHSAGSTSTTMRAVLKSLEVQQKKRYFLKLLSNLRKQINT